MLKKFIKKEKSDVELVITGKHNDILNQALIASSNSTLEEMVKCKNTEEMSKLSTRYQIEKDLSYQAHNRIGDYCCSNDECYIIINSLEAFKEAISKELKKADETQFDELCEKRYMANSLHSLFNNQRIIEKIEVRESAE